MEQENKELKEKVGNLEDKVGALEAKHLKREKQERRNNIIITENSTENLAKDAKKAKKRAEEILQMIKCKGTTLESAFQVALRRRGRRDIKVKLADFWEKVKIMQNKGALKGKSIFIDDDLILEEF